MRAEPIASRVYSQTIIELERTLPEPAQVLVSAGAWVQSDDIIACGERPGAVRIIDAAEALQIPCHSLADNLCVAIGQEVQAGDVLATAGFMGWRTVRAPAAGRIAEVVAGRIFIEERPVRVEVRASLPGQVVRLLPQRGAVIRSPVSRVVGIWGSGGECYGPLILGTAAATEPLHWTSINLHCRGKIIVGGQCLDGRVLLRAARFRALGLIVGGLAEHLRAKAEELGLAMLVTDALGAVPMAAPIFELLQQHQGRPGLLRGRKECALNIPLEAAPESVSAVPERPLTVGDRVRVTRAPYLGATGWIQGFQEEGNEGWAKVSLDQGRVVPVPYRNLERLG